MTRPARRSDLSGHRHGRAVGSRTTGARGGRLRPRRVLLATALAVAVAAGAVAPTTPAAAELPVGGLDDALVAYAFSPRTVPGANDWNCEPSDAHPRPVVLVHGTFENLGFNWASLSPMLRNAGYCVFALNYGATLLSLGERANGLTDIARSAGQLSRFVDRVLGATGAAEVDLVGHSQGGLMPNYYVKRLGGASKVDTLIGLAPSNHGTTLSGIVNLGRQLGLLTAFNLVAAFTAPSLYQQEVDSRFQRELFADGDTVPGVRYVVIATRHDLVVTPYTNAFLSGARNITIQDQCPDDPTGHIGLPFDRPALQNVLNELGPRDASFRPTCAGYGIGI